MKKILISLIVLLLAAVMILGFIGKIKIGNFEIAGIQNIKSQNDELDKKIEEISKLTSITYPEKMSELNSSGKKLLTSKQDYLNKVTFSSESDIEAARRIQNYPVQFLWTKIGSYATKQGVGIILAFTNGSTSLTKNLNITAVGQYIPISDFVSDLENDDQLNFAIENFKMEPEANGNLKATFVVKDLYLEQTTTITNEPPAQNTNNNTTNTTENNTTNNTTNTTQDNSTTNNTTNTTNTAS